MGENLLRDFSRVKAILLIHRIKQVEGVGEHVAGAARRVADFNALRTGDLEEITLWLLWRDVVLHLLCQP
ncbi:hypothetical protein D3C77_669920 [compost metagenome]